jgi:hypothetical protein
VSHLPRHKNTIKTIRELQDTVLSANPEKLKQVQLHKFIDKLQLGLINVHNEISETYFLS